MTAPRPTTAGLGVSSPADHATIHTGQSLTDFTGPAVYEAPAMANPCGYSDSHAIDITNEIKS